MPKTKTQTKTHQASPTLIDIPENAAAALAAVEPELAALAPTELVPINIDIPRAVAIAVGALPKLGALRPQIAAALPEHPLPLIDNLGTYALAAWQAHLLALPTTKGSGAFEALVEEATPLREDLLIAAEALAHKKLLDAVTVAKIRSGQGNIDRANDLVALSALFSQNWSKLEGKTTVTQEDITRAGVLGPLLLVAEGAREPSGVGAPDASNPAERRARAYTLFVRAYEEARRAVGYLRWHEDDVDAVVPSLFATRKGTRRAKPAVVEAPSEALAPAAAQG